MSGVPESADRRRILLVDDIELNRVLTEAVLRGATYEVDSVEDGSAAFAALQEKSYDLVLMDLEMPGVDGHTAAATIRREKPVKIAALSAHGAESDRERSRASGMAAHIARPITPRDLLVEIERVFCQPVVRAWDYACYAEWEERLGAPRMQGVLAKLMDQFCELQAGLDHAPRDAADIHRRAHDLASTAGMLGFHDVMRRCRAVVAPSGGIEDDACATLAESLQAAIVELEDHLDATAPVAAAV